MVERNGVRKKADKSLRAIDATNIESDPNICRPTSHWRVRMDIRHVALSHLPGINSTNKNVVLIAKHLWYILSISIYRYIIRSC